jgi:hypothetical protein
MKDIINKESSETIMDNTLSHLEVFLLNAPKTKFRYSNELDLMSPFKLDLNDNSFTIDDEEMENFSLEDNAVIENDSQNSSSNRRESKYLIFDVLRKKVQE